MVLPLCVTAGSQHLDRANGSLTRITVDWYLLTSLYAIPSVRTQVKREGPWLSSVLTVI